MVMSCGSTCFSNFLIPELITYIGNKPILCRFELKLLEVYLGGGIIEGLFSGVESFWPVPSTLADV